MGSGNWCSTQTITGSPWAQSPRSSPASQSHDRHLRMIEINVGKYNLRGADWDDDDPRGIVHIWEPPRASANYVVACDPSYGLASWDRALRTEDDEKTDNCAVQV